MAYKDVVKSDISFITMYSDYTPVIDKIIEKLEGTSIERVQTGAYVSTNPKSILDNTRAFYSSLPGDYSRLFQQYYNDHANSIRFSKIKKGNLPEGETTPIYGTKNSHIEVEYSNCFEDYTTAIHEYSHGISSMLNPNQLFDIEKYCISEIDSLFFEMIGSDFTSKRLNLKKHAINSSLDMMDDYLSDATILYSKLYMYMKTSFKWTKTNIENYFINAGYNDNEINDCMNKYFKDCFHYLYSYLCAIELYLIYKQDKKEALDRVLRIVKASDMNNKEYLNYVRSLGINPGENIYSYLDLLQKKDMELGNGKRLQYKIN